MTFKDNAWTCVVKVSCNNTAIHYKYASVLPPSCPEDVFDVEWHEGHNHTLLIPSSHHDSSVVHVDDGELGSENSRHLKSSKFLSNGVQVTLSLLK